MENNKNVCEGCECKCHGNNMNMCGGMSCGRWGGGAHHLLRWVIGILIIVFVFCAGLKLGMMVGYLNDGGYYGSHMFRKGATLQDGSNIYYRMGPGMMYGWNTTDNTQAPVPTK